MKTALVAGGAGFIGSNLCDRLLTEGQRVVCVDSLVTGRYRNIEHLVSNPNFTFIQQDISEPLHNLPPVHRIYHLASPASPPAYVNHPIATIRANTLGTLGLLELALRDGAQMLYASTSEIYGDPLDHPQAEESRACTNPVGPRSMYHEAKRCGEASVAAYIRYQGVDARIVRIFNVYGPRSDPDDGRLVPNFVCRAVENKPLVIYGDGLQTRSLCYVEDMLGGLIAAMETSGTRGEVYNLGNPEEHTVLEYARLIRAGAASSSPIEHRDPVPEEPRRRRPDISKAKRVLRWQPRVTLAEGLAATIEYFRREVAN
jgi:UDP-glucuronate decarboxylase